MSSLYSLYLECGGVVFTDSRRVVGGGLFFALSGENFDGNSYAAAALAAGAGGAVVSDRVLAASDSRFFYVEDTLVALQRLAQEHRVHLGIPIFALTGTNGKTTTKELVRVALGTRFANVGCTEGNFNNHIGVPLTLLSFGEQTEVGVVEMGANHIGEIEQLCGIAGPNLGLVNNVGSAHLEGFGGVEGVRRAKGELYDFLGQSSGVVLVNTDDAVLVGMVEERGLRHLSVGYSGVEDARGVRLQLFGQYNLVNAAAALAVADYFGCDREAVVAALEAYVPTNNRSEVVAQTPHGNRLIVDCYNANPSSMAVAVTEFLGGENCCDKVVILGSMKELGEYTEQEHRKLVEMCAPAALKLFVGEEFEGITEHFKTAQEAAQYIAQNPITGKQILLKGSRGNRLEELINLL